MKLENYTGQIKIFAGNFAPKGWAFCDGRELDISQYQNLFAVIGINYGGDGIIKFKIPDLRGRIPVGFELNLSSHQMKKFRRGSSTYYIGREGGSNSVLLKPENIPTHTHDAKFTGTGIKDGELRAEVAVNAYDKTGTKDTPTDGYWAYGDGETMSYKATGDIKMASDAVNISGTGIVDGKVSVEDVGMGEPLEIVQPFLGLNFIIALDGIFPNRS